MSAGCTPPTTASSWYSAIHPLWVPIEGARAVGDIGVQLHDIADHDDGSFAAAVTYTAGEQSWTQRFTAAIVDDGELAMLAAESGLQVDGLIGGDDAWVVLRPA